MKQFNEISTPELVELLQNKNVKVIDVRPVDSYNGWKIKKEKRGGHIKGAKSLPVKWTNYIDWIEIVRSKQIAPNNKIVIYAYSEIESKKVANLFVKADYTDVSIYNKFMEEWSNNEKLPMEHLARYKQLVSAEWVNQLVLGKNPDEYQNNKFVIVHSHYRNRDAYLTGHIPGAIDMDTLALESSETWNRRSPGELKKALEAHGITSDTTVVMYGKFMMPNNADEFPGSAAGHIGAIRNSMIMMYAGVKDVRVLNGGFQSWKDAGYEITTDDVSKTAVSDFGEQIPANPEIIVDIPKAKEMLLSNEAELVSTRSWSEFIGEVSGYNYIEKKGRIPGAIFGNCGTDAYHMENYRNLDHTIREAQEVAEIWKEVGITPDKHLAFYCGTGWRGSEAFYNAWLMGWPRVSVFDGGWFEWSNDPKNPFETGIPLPKNMLEKFIKDVDKGLSSYEKSIPSKYFYDKNGDALFIKIMHLPEYYVTRAELEIFKHQTKNIITALEINPKTYFQLLEFGAGDGLKTKELLHVLDKENYKFEYVPIDISRNALNSLEKKLSIELPNVSIKPKQGDYFEALKSLKDDHHPKVVLFLGSNIGNMTDETASKFMYRLGAFINPNDKLFLGVDLIKPQSIVLPAYNDSQGITKDFNLNLLKRINGELDANFEINNFYHQPEYSEKEGIVRSYLVSAIEQIVSIKKIKKVYKFKKGEKILTEISRKYNDETINEMIKNTDFKIIGKLSDRKKYFSNYVLVKS